MIEGALVTLTGVLQRQDEYLNRRAEADREKRFNIGRTVVKISADTDVGFLDEIDEFEKTFARSNPRTSREWALALDEALTGRAKAWRDFAILDEPGRGIYKATLGQNVQANAYSEYYRFIRAELFARCNLEEEHPGEGSLRCWENFRMPERIQHKEDLEGALETTILLYQQLVRHRMIVPGNLLDEQKLVIDLKRKVRAGTAFYV